MTIPAGYKCNQWGWFWRESDNSGPYFLDLDGQMAQGLPVKMFTDSNGDYARLRVDPGQTGFFAGREFMTFHEYAIPTGSSIAIRAVAEVNVILQKFLVDSWAGDIRLELSSGSTVTSPFVNQLPIMRSNMMTTADLSYVSQVDMDNGGTVIGGTLLDVFQFTSGNKGTAVETGADDPIGFPAGTYYVVISNIGNQTASGVFKARWEERP
jgi:hypothetical protein